MRKAMGHILEIACRVIVIGFGLQILLGILWLCNALGSVQSFAESSFWLKAAETFICDEYTGILYPLFLKIVLVLENIAGIPLEMVVPVVQSAVALCAGYWFCRRTVLPSKAWSLFGSGVLLTAPVIMQCHMSVLPYSFAFSFLLLQISATAKGIKNGNQVTARELFEVCLFWGLASLTLPEYLWLAAIPVLILLVYMAGKAKGQWKQLGYRVLLAAAMIGIVVSVLDLTCTPGAYGTVSRSGEATLFRRVAGSVVLRDYYPEWPEDVIGVISEEDMNEAESAEKLSSFLQPVLEQELGRERAREWFAEFGLYLLKEEPGRVLQEVAWDVCGYTLAPVLVCLYGRGLGYESCYTRNAESFLEGNPVLGDIYLQYGCGWFCIALAVSIVLQLREWFRKSKKSWWFVALCVGTSAGIVFWYTMQEAGLWDYKQSIFVCGIWLIWMLALGKNSMEEA